MKVYKEKSLKQYNSFGVNVKAKHLIICESVKDIISLDSKSIFKEKFFILGGGSNTLFTKDFDGTIIKMDIKGKNIIKEDKDTVLLKINAGEDWTNIVKWSVENNLLGIQNLALIPGTCGAAPVQNIGAYGSEIKDNLVDVEIYDIKTKKIKIITNTNCMFGYRDSIFKNKLKNKMVITGITLKLQKINPKNNVPDKYTQYGDIKKLLEERYHNKATLINLYKTICEIRKNKLPDIKEYGSCGSTFQNPIIDINIYEILKQKFPEIPTYDCGIKGKVKIPAAYILEKIGWKNKKIGNVGTWTYHPLIVTNYGNATGKDILEVIDKIRNDFYKETGIKLDTEINII
ncbi:MAG: UDP-N-acetylmuramate dehydrogenase [Candidatus Dojkabacteria bacterium]|nr:UDP-N-acetylmuramate dehydrogenase [Candidatus Dojkabacteria bacterium]